MSTFSSAIQYNSETINYTSASVPFGGSINDITLFTNTDPRQECYFYLYLARRISGGGAGAQLRIYYKLSVLDHGDSNYYDIGTVSETENYAFASNGVTHGMKMNVINDDMQMYIAKSFYSQSNPTLPTFAKIWVPPYHKLLVDLNNTGSNGGTYLLSGVIEKYKSTGS
jgi:hypothetical protein